MQNECATTQWSKSGVRAALRTASAGLGAVPNAGPLQTYNQVTTPPKLRARMLQHP